jgi:hypothetical protein
MPYSTAEKQKARNKRYYEANKEELKRKRREKYRLEKEKKKLLASQEAPLQHETEMIMV